MKTATLLLTTVLLFAACSLKKKPAGGAVNLQQSWNYDTSEQFWYTSQGSEILPYYWFVSLEMPDSEHLFTEENHIKKLGFIGGGKKSAINPGALPIGLSYAKRTDGVEVMGMTCAACHTGLMEIEGTPVLVEGAPALVDLHAFETELVSSLKATVESSEKFDRFAKKVGGDKVKLKADLDRWYKHLDARATLNAQKSNIPGYGRIDALGHIINDVCATDLGVPENAREPNAPVSFPFLWDTPQHDFVQWNGSAPNAGSGPILRNIGEVLGVWGSVAFQPFTGRPPLLPVYPVSTVDTGHLESLEGMVTALTSPVWPRNLVEIDESAVAAGQTLFEQNCQSCHLPINRTQIGRRVVAQMRPLAEIGTDPLVSNNFTTRIVKTGILKGSQQFVNPTEVFGDEAPAAIVLRNAVLGIHLANIQDGSPLRPIGMTTLRWDSGRVGPLKAFVGGLSADVRARLNTFRTISDAVLKRETVVGYKARPLDGIWATAPYLHNGSVPTLHDLLQDPEKRPKTFYVGNRKFDAKNVGYVSNVPYENGIAYFEYDTAIKGNSNAGHLYGTKLTDAQKLQLVEYLKTL